MGGARSGKASGLRLSYPAFLISPTYDKERNVPNSLEKGGQEYVRHANLNTFHYRTRAEPEGTDWRQGSSSSELFIISMIVKANLACLSSSLSAVRISKY